MASSIHNVGLPAFHYVDTFASPPEPKPADTELCAGIQTANSEGTTLNYFMILSRPYVVEKQNGFKKAVSMELVTSDKSKDAEVKTAILERRMILVLASFRGEIRVHESLKEALGPTSWFDGKKDIKLTTIKLGNRYLDFNASIFNWINDSDYSVLAMDLLIMKRIVPIPQSFPYQVEVLKKLICSLPLQKANLEVKKTTAIQALP